MKLLYTLCILISFSSNVLGYSYKVLKDGHVVHVVELDLKRYDMQFVKARDQVIGRETVTSMAERSNAKIAINGGFFEIGEAEDGIPSGTLIIDGKIFGLKDKETATLVKNAGQISIQSRNTNAVLTCGKRQIKIDKYNKLAGSEDVVLYTDAWGVNTLTHYNARYEVVFDAGYNKIHTHLHGNNAIPAGGFVISFPKKYISRHKGTEKDLKLSLERDRSFSALTGIPLLVQDGRLAQGLWKDTAFYNMPHARTAIGLKNNNKLIIVVAEHVYKKDTKSLTLEEIRPLITDNTISVGELQKAIHKEYSAKDKVTGLTIQELAKLMIELEKTPLI